MAGLDPGVVMKVLIFGNSGSGKSTLARRLGEEHGLTHLDLDSIVWEPGEVAVQRSADSIAASLAAGLEACLQHNSGRPWEPHKYASKEAQDAMLLTLQAWVADHYVRRDPWSCHAHRRVYDAFTGSKSELPNRDTARFDPEQR